MEKCPEFIEGQNSKMYYAYIMLCEDNSLYTGISLDIQERFKTHLQGKGSKYTRSHKPIRIVYSELYKNKSDAAKREYQIKGWSRIKKLNLIKFGRPVIT